MLFISTVWLGSDLVSGGDRE